MQGATTNHFPRSWKATWQTGKLLSGNSGNEASQDFDPETKAALNKAEYAGGAIYVTAGGTYEPLVGGGLCGWLGVQWRAGRQAGRSGWLGREVWEGGQGGEAGPSRFPQSQRVAHKATSYPQP